MPHTGEQASGKWRGPYLYFSGVFISSAFTPRSRRLSVAECRGKRKGSAKGSGNHGNDHNFNDEPRTISKFLKQERSSCEPRKEAVGETPMKGAIRKEGGRKKMKWQNKAGWTRKQADHNETPKERKTNCIGSNYALEFRECHSSDNQISFIIK